MKNANLLATKDAIIEALFRREAEARAGLIDLPRQARIASLRSYAKVRSEIARELQDARHVGAAVALYRDAATLLVEAHALEQNAPPTLGSASGASSPTPPSVVDKLQELAHSTPTGLPPAASFERALRVFAISDPASLDDLPLDDALLARSSVEEVLAWLERALTTRPVAEIRRQRWVRLGATTLVLLLVGWWGISRVFASTQLAIGKPVTASSRFAGSTAPVDNSGLVNGKIESTFGIHTAPESRPAWVQVDLLAPHAIKEVRIYNRGEANWQDEGLPMALSVSDDGVTFAEVEKRTTTFTQMDPWVWKAHGRSARFVRVGSPTYIAIAELEVTAAR